MPHIFSGPPVILLLGRLLGFRRNRRGFSVVLLIFGIFGCVAGCPLALFGAPYSIIRSRQVAALPRPEPAQLRATAPGTSLLIAAQIAPDAPADSHGLALAYVEARQIGGQQDREAGTPGTGSSSWQIEQPPPPTFEMQLLDGEPVTIQMTAKPSFLNAQRIEARGESVETEPRTERRFVGYLPGQTLTVEGVWEGSNRITAGAFYSGTPDDYLNFLTYTQPAGALLMGLVCGLLGLVLVIGGGAMRVLGY